MAHDLILRALPGLAAALAAAGALAETLPDPTRPPAFLFAPVDGEAAEKASGGFQLQSVLIGPGRRSAIIGGRHLSVGDRLGEFTLVRVGDTEVVLKGPEGSRTLKLFPAVDKRVAQAAEPAQGIGSRASKDPAQP